MISILIPAYNTADYIEECLDSIYKQKCLNEYDYEILVGVDGCEKTLDKLQEIKHKYTNLRIIFMKQNCGLFITLNTLLSISKYETIIKFDSDDIMLPNLIEKVLSVDADLVRFKFYLYFNDKKIREFHTHANGVYKIRKSVYQTFGGYQPWKCAADTEFLERFNQQGKFSHVKLDEKLFLYRQHVTSLSKTIPFKEGSLRLEYHKKFKNKKYDNFYVQPVLGEFLEVS